MGKKDGIAVIFPGLLQPDQIGVLGDAVGVLDLWRAISGIDLLSQWLALECSIGFALLFYGQVCWDQRIGKRYRAGIARIVFTPVAQGERFAFEIGPGMKPGSRNHGSYVQFFRDRCCA